MPVNPTLRSLAQDGRFSQADAQTLRQAVQSGQVSQAEAKDAADRYAEAMDPEAARTLQDSFQASPRARLSSLPEGMLGQTLERGMRSDAVQTLQRGLMAVGLSSRNPGMALGAGADGIFGRETETSVRAFQKASGLPETGKADPTTLKALQQALTGTAPSTAAPPPPSATTPPPAQTVRPATGLRRPEATPTTPATPATTPERTNTPSSVPGTTPAVTPAPAQRAAPTVGVTLPEGVKPGTREALIAAAQDLATGDRAKHYGTVNPWRNIDPNHSAPVDVRMGGLANRWKCNLFGGNAMAAAGFEPPYYGKTGKGEYPVAEQWHRWSTPSAEFRARAQQAGEPVTDYAKSAKNPSRFELADEVKPTQIPDEAARRARVEALLARVQPGDVVTVDHPGASGSDGGHVRVCVGRDESGKPLFAQARQDSATVEAEGIDDDNWLTRDAIYILRPTTPRPESR